MFAAIALSCAYIVHAHIAHRIGSPIGTFIVGKSNIFSFSLKSWIQGKKFNDITTIGKFGDRVVFGELFALIVTFLGLLIAIDSIFDVFPDFSTDDFMTKLILGKLYLSGDQYKLVEAITLTLLKINCAIALLTLTLFFYTINSDRVTGFRSDSLKLQIGAGEGSDRFDAPKLNAEGAMEKMILPLLIPSIEEMRRDFLDPEFVSKMSNLSGFVTLELTELDLQEAELMNEFLRPTRR